MKLPFEHLLSYGMNRANLAVMPALVEGFASLGLHAREAAILWLVQANPGCSQVDIARALGVQRTNLAPIVGKLVKAGFIDRRSSDGRTNALALSAAGHELMERIQEVTDAHEERFFGHLSPDDQRHLLEIWRDLRLRAEQQAPS